MAAAAIVLAAVIGLNAAVARGTWESHIKVAAIGWLSRDSGDCPDVHSEEGFEALFAKPVAEAAAQGARLIVSGEMGFLDRQTRGEWLRRFAEMSRRYGVMLAVGCFDAELNENRVLFFDRQGATINHYVKTHLTPFEHSRRGDGRMTIADVGGVGVGVMICQDDNFDTLVRSYGRTCGCDGGTDAGLVDRAEGASETTIHRASSCGGVWLRDQRRQRDHPAVGEAGGRVRSLR